MRLSWSHQSQTIAGQAGKQPYQLRLYCYALPFPPTLLSGLHKRHHDLRDIDLSKEVYAFVSQAGSMMTGTTITTGMVAILDKPSAFEALIKKKMPSASIKKEKDISYTILQNGVAIGWNDDVVVANEVASYQTSRVANPPAGSGAQQQLMALFNLKEETSLSSVDTV